MKSDNVKSLDIEDILPLTPMQEAMLFHYISSGGNELYLEQICLNILGPLDTEKLTAAWSRVIDMHPALRTCYRWKKVKQPVQLVLKQFRLTIDRYDLSGFGAEEQNQAFGELKEELRRAPLDLESVPLRVSLVKMAEKKLWMAVTYHHIVMDGWSAGIVLYQALRLLRSINADESDVPTQPPPFKSYVCWLSGRDREAQAGYWKRYLEGMAEPTILPPMGRGEGTGNYTFALAGQLYEELKRVSQDNRVTLAAVIYSAWGVLLSRYCDTSDVMFGATVSVRPAELPGAGDMVGLMINTLPLRLAVLESRTARELWIALFRDIEGREPFTSVSPVDLYGCCPAEARGDDLFETVVVVENYPLRIEGGDDDGLRVADYCFFERTHYPATVLVRLGEEIAIDFIYQRSKISDENARNACDSLLRILRFMSQNSNRPLVEIDLLDARQKEELLLLFNDTGCESSGRLSFLELWRRAVRSYPGRTAVAGWREDRLVELTFEQLDEGARRLAAHLRAMGCGPGRIVALMMERTPDLSMAMIGILMSGAAYLPLDGDVPLRRIEFMLLDSDARFLVTDRPFGLEVPGVESLAKIVIAEDSGWRRPVEEIALDTPPHRQDAAYVIYTSGTSGRPKGVVIGHGALANFIEGIVSIVPFSCEDCLLSLTTVSFDIFVLESLLPLSCGSTVCVGTGREQMEPGMAASAIEARGVTVLQITPSRLQVFLTNDPFRRAIMALNFLLVGGEPFSGPLQHELGALGGKRRLFNMYGPTETTVWSTVKEICGKGSGSVGYPIANTGVFILSRAMTLQPVGVPGELYIGGLGLASGYLNRQELTAEAFVELDPGHFGLEITHRYLFNANGKLRLYKTGDLAFREADGSISFIGRCDRQVKIRGFRIEPAEIEHALRRHPQVKEAAVLPGKGSDGLWELRAYIQVEDADLPDRLREYLKGQIPDYMIPARFVAVDRFPLTVNGKLDRRALAAMEPPATAACGDREEGDSGAADYEKLVMEIWSQVLELERVPMNRPFFELGGNSLLMIRVHSRLQEAVDHEFPIAVLFRYPTVRRLAKFLRQEAGDEQETTCERQASASGPVAVVGMACRFPGAWNTGQFWENVSNGIECVRRLDLTESLAAGGGNSAVRDAAFVRAKGMMPGYDLFAAEFFDYSAREAEMMDPQLRLLHELAWEAFEDACVDPFSFIGRIGLFVGAMEAVDWLNYFRGRAQSHSQWLGAWSLGDRDFLATRVASRLNLRGPAMTIQTACSTSLVAIDAACQALISGRAELALAGGVSFTLEDQAGYRYEDGMVRSPDGHCRAFDRDASGTVGGNGGGLVALMRMEAVDHRRYHVIAVIQGSAVNNDGNRKVGFTAPSIEGQAEVIRQAIEVAGIDPASIGYIEAHGTGTKLGDPVEIEGLASAYPMGAMGRCAIGSVKSAIGHLDAAAGVAGLIKAVLALREGKIPPGLNVTKPNPAIGFERTPFYVNTRLRDWRDGDAPRRAAVSSFGIGGTNAHVLLQEAPQTQLRESEGGVSSRKHRILLLSAKDEEALASIAENTAIYLRRRKEASLQDVCHTLQTGRRFFSRRWAGVAADREEAIDMLSKEDELLAGIAAVEETERACVFLFPGQGAQYGGMGRELYRDEPIFRRSMDRCFEILKRYSPVNFLEAWDGRLLRTEAAQPLLFAFEYSLARLLMEWGIGPSVMMGHSIGEYTAACLAGVMRLDEALRLVAARGRLMQAMPEGSMLAVQAPEDRTRFLLEDVLQVSIAAVNTPGMCVISGESPEIQRMAGLLEKRGIVCRPLHTSHAFHSPMMEPVMEAFAREVEGAELHPPVIPFISNVTGRLITPERAVDPAYWAAHLREPVRWSAGLETLANMENPLFIEVGPGRTLTTFAVRHPRINHKYPAVQLVKHPQDNMEQDRFFYGQIGKLWLHGLPVDWQAFNLRDTGRSISLPTYPFKRQRYWAESLPGGNVKPFATDGWLHWAGWDDAPLDKGPERRDLAGTCWLILSSGSDEPLLRYVRESGGQVVEARVGANFSGDFQSGFQLDPGNRDHYERLVSECRGHFTGPIRVTHLWNIDSPAGQPCIDRIEYDINVNFYSLVYLIQAFAAVDHELSLKIWMVTSGAHSVAGEEATNPAGALATGPARVIPAEYPSVVVTWIDCHSLADDCESLKQEIFAEAEDRVVALRGDRRFVPCYRQIEPDACRQPLPLKRGGVYLVTGGLGALGRTVTEYLLDHWDARVVSLNTTLAPERDSWRRLLQSPGTSPEKKRRIQFLIDMEVFDDRLLCVAADVANPDVTRAALDAAATRFGSIHGIFHCAGTADGRLTPLVTEAWARRVMAPKVLGLMVLDQLVDPEGLDFVAAFSSINAIAPAPGQVCYASANAFMDAYCQYRNHGAVNGPFYMSVNWDAWAERGMAVSQDFGSEPVEHPLFFGRRPQAGLEILESRLHADDCWLLAEHRLGESRLLPGTAYLELAVAAAMLQADRQRLPSLREVYFQSPLLVAKGEEVVLQTCLQPESGGFRFTIRSLPSADMDAVVHASGMCCWNDDEEDDAVRLDEMMRGMGPVCRRQEGGIRYGDRWNTFSRTYLGDRRAAAVLRLPPQFAGDLDVYRLHPAMLDSATMFACQCMDEPLDDLLPFYYRKITIHRPLPAEAIAIAEWSFDGGRAESLSLDIVVATAQGERVATIEGFVMKRAMPASDVRRANEELFIGMPGDLNSLEYRDTPRRTPAEGEIEVEIVATGLNYKEVLLALGVLPAPDDDSVSFGLECSGIVSEVGPGVTEFKAGDAVICYGDSLFGRYRCLPARQAAHKPLNAGFYEAAGIPLAFLTAYYGLIEYGRLDKGERALIHSASGGVGMAAVAIGRYMKAEIFATAGNEEKREYLRSIGIEHVMDSRSPAFAREVAELTGGGGVDVILNSLSGEYIELGLSVLAPYGRFVEIGLRDILENRPLGMRTFQRGVSFMALQVSTGIPGLGEVLRRIARHIEEGDFAPTPVRVFQRQDAGSAFRFMAGSRHRGKIVIARQQMPEDERRRQGLTHQQGLEALLKVLRLGRTNAARRMSHIIVTPNPFDTLVARVDHGIRSTHAKKHQPTNHSRPNLATAFEPPGSGLEETLAAIFREFLGLERIGVQDNFFELGATSLDMIQVGNRLKSDLNRDVPVVKLFNHPTIRSLSEFLLAEGRDEALPEGMDTAAELAKKGKDRLKERRRIRRG